MIDPALGLLVFGAIVLVASALFWPRRGIASRLLSISRMSERVRLEDALKHIFKCEYAQMPCSVDSVAGAVGVSRSRAVDLLGRLEERGLALAVPDGFLLTGEGREYALHIVRTHRLLERYLADRTGVLPEDWHGEAERREHDFTPEDRESLATRLGHPLYDPHGDPIPTASGDLPPRTGVPLSALRAGDTGSIVHLGDEPRSIFEALTKIGLTPLMTVRVSSVSAGEVRFAAGGREHRLSPVVARHVTIELSPGMEPEEEVGDSLADLTEGESARVMGIHPALQGPQRRRLLDLGLVPGTQVEAELDGTAGDPVAYRVRGALIALRKDQSRWIQVRREGVMP